MNRSVNLYSVADPRRELHEFVRQQCLFYPTGSQAFYSKNGRKYQWLLDLRPLLLNGRMLRLVSELFWDVMAEFWPFQVAGLEMTAIPLVAGILAEGDRRGFDATGLVVRQKRKKYGREKLVEGKPVAGRAVVLVDDAVNSARSVNMTLSAIGSEGLSACAAFAIVHFGSEAAREWSERNDITFRSLFSPADFCLVKAREPECSTRYEIAWTFASPTPNYRFAVAKSAPVVHAQSVMFGSDTGIFWCLDKKTGAVRWRHDTRSKVRKGIVSTAAIMDGRVYFGCYNGKLYCLDASDGREIWAEQVCDWIGSSPCHAKDHIYIGLEYNAPFAAGGLAKFCAQTGRRIWEAPTRQMLHGSPVYSEEHDAVVIGTNDGTVLVVEAASGEVLQLLKVGGPVKYHCALSGDVAIFGSFDGKIYVWNYVEDSVALEVQTDNIVYSRPLVDGDCAYVGCADHTIRILDLRLMREIKSIDVGEKVHSSPALVGETVFVGTSGGELIGIDRRTLDITHRWQFPERLTNSVAYDDGLLYVYGYDNRLFAVRHAP